MQIVIDIPEKVYGLLRYFEEGLGLTDKRNSNDDVKTALMRAVIHGIPLPEHHGRIIDESQIRHIEVHTERELYGNKIRYVKVTDAPTIIEADKE